MTSTRRTPRSSRASFDLLVVGHTNIDHILFVPSLPAPDRTVPILRQRTELGGTAANLARAAAQEGVSVGLVSRIGRDFPREFLRRLRSDGVALSGLETVARARSPTCFVVEDGKGSQMTFIDQGPMGDAKNAAVPSNLIRRSSWIHLATGDPGFQLRIAREARAAGRRVAIDPAQEIHYRWNARSLSSLFSTAELFFANEAEARRAAELLGLASVHRLTDRVPIAVITRGHLGAEAYFRGGVERVPARSSVRTVRVTGAGDAFRGGFYAAWLAGRPLRDALRRGAEVAARWIARPPATAARASRRVDRMPRSPTPKRRGGSAP